MFLDAIGGAFKHCSELVGLCDISPTRMNHWNRLMKENHGLEPRPTYTADRFDQMIRETKPDVVIVTTVDSTHHQYIIRAMELGKDVVCEKPMTIDAQKCKAIFDAIERTGKSLRVTFNYRYTPMITKLREVVASGAIGTPQLVDLQWRLDTSHGADYFRRWHREKDKSGGLLVHKSTHHFDMVNYVIGDAPETVFAFGGTKFYGEKNAAARGQHYAYDRYTGHVTPKQDPFALVLEGEGPGSVELKSLYRDAEADSGYIRDRNVFGGEDKWPITAEDTVAVTARYRRGAILSYSLVAYCPWEGERMTVTGDQGQVEYFTRGTGHIIAGQSDEELAKTQYPGERYIRLQRMFEAPQMVEIPEATGSHGGGDALILDRIFNPNSKPDPFGRDAGPVDGAASILMGICANQSIATGQVVRVDDVFPLGQHLAKRTCECAAV
jgi:predicted dehydrogenase